MAATNGTSSGASCLFLVPPPLPAARTAIINRTTRALAGHARAGASAASQDVGANGEQESPVRRNLRPLQGVKAAPPDACRTSHPLMRARCAHPRLQSPHRGPSSKQETHGYLSTQRNHFAPIAHGLQSIRIRCETSPSPEKDNATQCAAPLQKSC